MGYVTEMYLQFYPSDFNVQTCLMKHSSCPKLLMHMLHFEIKEEQQHTPPAISFRRRLLQYYVERG